MAVQPSNARFMRFCTDLRARIQDYIWVIFAWLIALINDRLLPQNRALDARKIADWCREFLAAHDAGDHQYRGRPIDPEFAAAMARTDNVGAFTYRGIKVRVKSTPHPSYLLNSGTAVPFVPTYQLQLRKWILQSRMTDKDFGAAAPEIHSRFRGREI